MAGVHPIRVAWGVLLATVAGYAAYCSWDDSRYAHLRLINAAAAHAERPTESFALGKVIDGRITRGDARPITDAEVRASRESLAQTPLSRTLLRIIGMEAEANGHAVRADAAMMLSNRVSRRDPLTQLWLIERSVRNEDMTSALRHYHAALSVRWELGEVLYPILAKAISFPEVRTALRPYVESRSRWVPAFLQQAIRDGNPADVAMLIIPIGEVMREESLHAVNAALISKLVEKGDLAIAMNVARSSIPALDAEALSSLGINKTTLDRRLGALGWSLAEEGRILAMENEEGGFDVEIAPLSRGLVASRSVSVRGGNSYSFGQTIRSSSPRTTAVLTWRAFCLSAQPKALIWEQRLADVSSTQRFRATIAIPPHCKGIELGLSAEGPDGQQPAHIGFESFELKPAPD